MVPFARRESIRLLSVWVESRIISGLFFFLLEDFCKNFNNKYLFIRNDDTSMDFIDNRDRNGN